MPSLKWTLEKIIEVVEEQGYEFIEYIEGVGKETRIKIWCKNPNHESYITIFNTFNRGARCSKCYHENRMKWTDEKIEEYVIQRGYKYLGKKGKGIASKIKVQCPRGHEPYEVGLFAFSHECDCMECFKEDFRTSENEIIEEVEKRGDKLVEILEYHSLETDILLRCDKCNRDYKIKYYKYLEGGTCSYCSETKGEKRIRKFLENNNIEFKTQYRTNECRNKHPLPFDFYIILNNKKIMLEYDGLEHFQPVDFFGGEEKFKTRKENDEIKDNYCKSKNIELIRIPYWDFDNIEKILEEKLNLK